MKRLVLLLCYVALTAGWASAQKKEVAAMSEELNAIKAKEIELSQQVNSLKADNAQLLQKINELKAVSESNKALVEQLKTMVAAYSKLEGAHKSTSEDVAKLAAKIDALIAKLESSATTKNEQPTEPAYEVVGNLCNGLVLVRQGLLYGYVNAKGEQVISAQFEEARSFTEGLAAVKKDDKWGYINTSGAYVIPAQFAEAHEFGEWGYNGMARVNINGKWGVINKTGKYVVAAQYDYITRRSGSAGLHAWFGQKTDARYIIYRDGTVEKY